MRRRNSLITILEGEQSEVQSHENDRHNSHKHCWDIAMLQRALHNTEDGVQSSLDQFIEALSGRNPHRFRLMKDFPRPPNMPDKIFMESLWCEFKQSEKWICEESLGAQATEQEGGYKKAFHLLQRIHGVKHLDDLLREEVKRRWERYLKQDIGNRLSLSNPQQLILGSRRINTTSCPIRRASTDRNAKRKDPPEGGFEGRKRVRLAGTPVPDLAPRRLPNLANLHHRARVPIQKPRRQSTLRREIRYEENSDVRMKIFSSSLSDLNQFS